VLGGSYFRRECEACAREFRQRRDDLLKIWDKVGVFDPHHKRPSVVPRSRRFPSGLASLVSKDRRRKYLDVAVPEDSFRMLFADIFVGHQLKVVRPSDLKRPAMISRRFEGILRAAAEHEPQRNKRKRQWQIEARAIMEEEQQRRRILSRQIPDGSQNDLLLRAFGAYLILANRDHCTREEFLSEGSPKRPGMFRKMVDAAAIPFPECKPGMLAQRLKRAGGNAAAIARADAHIISFYPELRPWRMSFGRRPHGWHLDLLPKKPGPLTT
jgi:hypothetical protein